MTLRLVAFEPEHALGMKNYGGQESLFSSATLQSLKQLAEAGPSWTGFIDDRLIACAGLIRANQMRAQAWALLQNTGNVRDFIHLHRTVQNVFASSGFRYIETFTDPLHITATRWVRAIGFKVVVPYRPYFFPDGRGATEWALYTGRASDADEKRNEPSDGLVQHCRVSQRSDLRTHEGEVRQGQS